MEGGSGVLFGQDADNKGSWTYDGNVGLLLVCFAASRNNIPLRRHALKMVDKKTFVLLSADHDVYNEEHIWPNGSVTHRNQDDIVMLRVDLSAIFLSRDGLVEPYAVDES